ncbi:MAG: xanthine dehydrogenase molybdopterin binding subunit [Planctomycetota bacterium]
MPSIGQSIPHDSAPGHVTGEAPYVEDMTPLQGELCVEVVGSPAAAGRLLSVEVEQALALPGVVGVYTHEDMPNGAARQFGPIFHDEPFLVYDEVSYVGQPVAVIAAESREVAHRAAALIKVNVEEASPILTIPEAIAADSYLGPIRHIQRGDLEVAFAQAPHTLEGVFHNNGQEQFYLESQACQAIPGEQGQVKLICSTQNPTETQAVVAEGLGLSMHQVVCECKRMGGGFGGKETQSAIPAFAAALAAQLTGRPARIVYGKTQDMKLTGKRHPYESRYRVAFDGDGRLRAAEFEFFSNGGAFADLSTSIMERTMLHADNAYYLPVVKITGRICKTNLPPNTAFRGFGGPQGVLVIENILQEIAQSLGLDALDVRRRNAYVDGDPDKSHTPYGQLVRDHVIHETFDQLEQTSEYRNRMAEVEAFNAKSKTHVKGLAMSAIKFGISFTTKFLNQGNALVHVFTDGTVQVSTGGTEMGQGLNTKIRQLVADEFGITPDDVMLMTTSTEKNHNTSPTAASAGTDLNGTAAVNACRDIRTRMAEFAAELLTSEKSDSTPSPEHIRLENGEVFDDRHPEHKLPFGQFCDAARRERVDLGARGFYATPGVDFDRETGIGTPFFYFTTGAAAAEVTIDRFTGDLVVDRVDLLMDVGQMINPGIDRGQLYGGFIQGMGWCTTEELVYSPEGALLSASPTTYKIPNITDTPAVFNVETIPNPKHKTNVRLSKAVGEPPLMLGVAPWLAVKHAMSFIAPDAIAPLELPATNEQILMCMTGLVAEQAKQSV